MLVKHLPAEAATWAVTKEPQSKVATDPQQIAAYFGGWGLTG